jgi:hypothetical protein
VIAYRQALAELGLSVAAPLMSSLSLKVIELRPNARAPGIARAAGHGCTYTGESVGRL